ncbi:MAG TPA: anhydro-N-acetylmuramic acid kinase, partial [Phycisphaerales bacterium]|nr:anhydro-N-acetylmuramic acid kinase [Phycisphaerales bacterium]
MSEPHTHNRHAVGVMTGTSIDAIDASLVRLEGHGLNIRAKLVRHVSQALGLLEPRMRAAADQQPMTAGAFAALAWDFGLLHAEVIVRCVGADGALHEKLNLICCHGQTVYHKPPVSWQLLNPAPIAYRFRCPVICDLRQADLAAGGQGAPITPIADWVLFRSQNASRAIINLGGFCNITLLPKEVADASDEGVRSQLEEIRGFDVCACNHILNAVARAVLNTPYDEDGAAALKGRAPERFVAALLEMLTEQRQAGRSLGTSDELADFLQPWMDHARPDDLAAGAVEAVARCITDRLQSEHVDELVLAGGGGHNRALVKAIAHWAGRPVMLTSDLGVPISARESMCFAVLGGLSAD